MSIRNCDPYLMEWDWWLDVATFQIYPGEPKSKIQVNSKTGMIRGKTGDREWFIPNATLAELAANAMRIRREAMDQVHTKRSGTSGDDGSAPLLRAPARRMS